MNRAWVFFVYFALVGCGGGSSFLVNQSDMHGAATNFEYATLIPGFGMSLLMLWLSLSFASAVTSLRFSRHKQTNMALLSAFELYDQKHIDLLPPDQRALLVQIKVRWPTKMVAWSAFAYAGSILATQLGMWASLISMGVLIGALAAVPAFMVLDVFDLVDNFVSLSPNKSG